MSAHVAHADRSPPTRADSDRGLTLLYVFTGAMVVMVGDVILAGAIGHMWILVPVMGVFLLMTFGVFVVIMRLLADDGEGQVPDAFCEGAKR